MNYFKEDEVIKLEETVIERDYSDLYPDLYY